MSRFSVQDMATVIDLVDDDEDEFAIPLNINGGKRPRNINTGASKENNEVLQIEGGEVNEGDEGDDDSVFL